MKTVKIADLTTQLLITICYMVYALVQQELGQFLNWYLVLGGWQLLSFLSHFLTNKGCVNRVERKYYGQTLLWLIIIGLVTLLLSFADVPLIIFYLLAMLVAGPVMAVWYFIITIKELKALRKREFIHLK
jgi:hypothetical protein